MFCFFKVGYFWEGVHPISIVQCVTAMPRNEEKNLNISAVLYLVDSTLSIALADKGGRGGLANANFKM